MSAPQWEEIEVPRGQYIGWGFRPGQTVTGKVLSFSHNGGTDAKGAACPQISLELTEACESYRDKGTTRETVAAGELVVINAGLVSLRRALNAAQPDPGDLIKLTFASTVQVTTPNGPGEVKEFKVQIARGAGGPATPRQAPAAAGGFGADAAAPAQHGYTAEPPF